MKILTLIFEIFCIQKTLFLWNICQASMSSRHRFVNSHSNIPSENENDDRSNQIEVTTEILQDQTSVEPNKKPTENAQQNPLQSENLPTPKCILNGHKLQQHFSEIFSIQQIQLENKRLRQQHQKRIDTASQFSWKYEVERNFLIQHMNQRDTDFQDDNKTLENTRVTPSTSINVPPQQVAIYEFSFPTPLIFHVITEITERRKKHLLLIVSVWPKLSNKIQQKPYFWRSTVIIANQSLWLENTMNRIYVFFFIKLLNQVLQMHLPP